ncbi:MAG: STAS domain-containing protein [Magnetococcales bacterium]|nr:STAS domain-containing protein [Magnetococcales bacterium]
MPIQKEITLEATRLNIIGTFNFLLYQEFLGSIQDPFPGRDYVVDLSQTSFMDSSALGMLLLLRKQAQENNARISIINSNSVVRKILYTANLNRFFDID